MRLRNCPKCYGDGVRGHVGRCGYCHGKRKVNSEFVKWDTKRATYSNKVANRVENELNVIRQEMINKKTSVWETKNPKPRKFPKSRD